MEIHKSTEFPRRVEGEESSIEVITCDIFGSVNLAFYNFDMKIWLFYADTSDQEVDFVWIYIPIERMKKEFKRKKPKS